MRRKIFRPSIVCLSLLFGCGGDAASGPIDAAPGDAAARDQGIVPVDGAVDAAVSVDAAADFAPSPDLARPPDLAVVVDMVRPADMVVLSDLARVPDLVRLPDLVRVPDLVEVPDLVRVPDLTTLPDLVAVPDLAEPPDFAPPQDLVMLPDLAPPPDLTSVPVLINFDNIGGTVTTQYAQWVTFSSQAGYVVRTWSAGSYGQSPPNYVCTGPTSGSVECAKNVYLDFTNPVSRLKLRGIAVGNTGKVAVARVFHGSGQMSDVDVIGAGNNSVPVVVDLSTFSGVTRLEISQVTDSFGIGWDDVSFQVP